MKELGLGGNHMAEAVLAKAHRHYFCKYPHMQQYVIFNALKVYCIPKEDLLLVKNTPKIYLDTIIDNVAVAVQRQSVIHTETIEFASPVI
jgi:hypothetical protein